ncbi:DUF559 domain-containing protein [Steroidobacter sp.]|uniref:DUF559 domain-containing protein n=1 Tax=Steroidobacter sp. TaxID=1978227 RepID=UPI001A40D13C|nr:DUF559 domain-containing protein [Steroidobacter sp.]MBL8269578.1 DUF559 domain-containing protein [Steroidobacter sp.]
MLNGIFNPIFKDRAAKERAASEEQALAELLAARELRHFPLTRHCEIGPFAVEYLFAERALIVELGASSCEDFALAERRAGRRKFLNDMGYTILVLDGPEVLRQPRRALARIRAALEV